jgi:hypothetical protein
MGRAGLLKRARKSVLVANLAYHKMDAVAQGGSAWGGGAGVTRAAS